MDNAAGVYTLQFTEAQLRILDQALGELPYKIAAHLIWHINEQIKAGQCQGAAGREHRDDQGK